MDADGFLGVEESVVGGVTSAFWRGICESRCGFREMKGNGQMLEKCGESVRM